MADRDASIPIVPRVEIPRKDLERAEALGASLAMRDPWWAPQLLVAGAIALDFLLPNQLAIGPSWLLPGVEGLLLIGLLAATPRPHLRHSPQRRRLALGLTGLVSLVNFVSLILLCHYLLHHGTVQVSGNALIRSGVVLWVTNVLLFGLWYWELDRGGALARALSIAAVPDFLFPQMTDPKYAAPDWLPGLVDYLYVSFTNATAFSPTDTMPLTPMAKSLMGGQALASLITVGLVVARAVNILR